MLNKEMIMKSVIVIYKRYVFQQIESFTCSIKSTVFLMLPKL